MGRIDKRLQQMKGNPRDWRIEEIQSVADALGIEWVHDGGSHVIFRSPYGAHVSIPAKRPIKPVYVTMFIQLVQQVESLRQNRGGKVDENAD
jgi:predicted RNA binding protein YcfA (HicA-like mRNA interferase family)